MFCTRCGKEIPDDSEFCGFCGASTTHTHEYEESFTYVHREYDRKKIKQEAKDAISGSNLWWYLLAVIVSSSICGALSFSIVGSLLVFIFEMSLFILAKQLLFKKKLEFVDLFAPFKKFGKAMRSVGAGVLIGLIVFAGCLLFIIPGIIWAIAYSQTIYLLTDDESLGVTEAMRKSKEIMQGHKWQYFVFLLSFIGHFLLVCITFGIWSIYFIPYSYVAKANYYSYLRGLEA